MLQGVGCAGVGGAGLLHVRPQQLACGVAVYLYTCLGAAGCC
jgi:hypothetical protein